MNQGRTFRWSERTSALRSVEASQVIAGQELHVVIESTREDDGPWSPPRVCLHTPLAAPLEAWPDVEALVAEAMRQYRMRFEGRSVNP